MFFFTKNLITQVLESGVPWEFQPTEKITAQIRHSKEDRQDWYSSPATSHQFYTGIEPINPNIRPGKENPPHKIHAFTADFDVAIPDARADEAIASMKHKPAWVERSLGGNLRLVWLLSEPLLVDDYSFCAYILDAAKSWLQVDLLPAFDEPAFLAPSRLLCNGCNWRSTGHGAIPAEQSQAFFVSAGSSFRFTPANAADIPLEQVEKALKEKFPSLNWPGDFALESQGPSFWIPESVSPLSAIVKATGMFTFSANAIKPFYTWTDILGKEFVTQFTESSVSKATTDIWWDSKHFWRKIGGSRYASSSKDELLTYFKVDCSLSTKALKGGASPTDVALAHIYSQNRIKGAAPFVFRPSGLIEFLGERVLNTYLNRAIQPATGTQVWGPLGNFPFISALLEALFDPVSQLPHYLAWVKHLYESAFYMIPAPGQNIFLMGGVGTGKTLVSRQVIGVSIGGYMDASDYLVNGANFNSHLMNYGLWCLDDDTPSNSPAANAKLHAMFKKTAANQQHISNEKFEKSAMCEWAGRICCTTNLDHVSARIVGPMDNSSLDKTCLFRCAKEPKIVFPSRTEVARLIAAELPYFLRYLLDWSPPDFVERDSRYGYKSFHEPSLLDQTHQSNPMAPFKELLIESLNDYFANSPDAPCWRGTVSQVIKLIISNPLNESVMRSIRLEQTSRYLEQIQKEALLKCRTEVGPMKTRIWVFDRPEGNSPKALPAPTGPETITTVPIFT
jgi:hypothetical protein